MVEVMTSGWGYISGPHAQQVTAPSRLAVSSYDTERISDSPNVNANGAMVTSMSTEGGCLVLEIDHQCTTEVHWKQRLREALRGGHRPRPGGSMEMAMKRRSAAFLAGARTSDDGQCDYAPAGPEGATNASRLRLTHPTYEVEVSNAVANLSDPHIHGTVRASWR